jgi:hypothetical protein
MGPLASPPVAPQVLGTTQGTVVVDYQLLSTPLSVLPSVLRCCSVMDSADRVHHMPEKSDDGAER